MLARLLFNRIEKSVASPVAHDQGRCLRRRLSANTCSRCLDICKQGALTTQDRELLFSEDKCTGCMACVAECPNDAFSCGFDLDSLLSRIRAAQEEQPVILGCKKCADHESMLFVPCLGLLSEPLLAALHSVAPGACFLDVRHCADCVNGSVLGVLTERLQGIVKKIGAAADLKIRYLFADTLPQKTTEQQRRFFLHFLQKEVSAFGREMMTDTSGPHGQRDTMPEGDSRKKGATRKIRLLLDALSMQPGETKETKNLLLSYFYTLDASVACDLCPSCTGMCPTGALKRRTTENGKKQLAFISAQCSGCGLCIEFCKKKALSMRAFSGNEPATTLFIA
ncbi:MAG: 4Fe-4S binding protein [Desulfopila sp.]